MNGRRKEKGFEGENRGGLLRKMRLKKEKRGLHSIQKKFCKCRKVVRTIIPLFYLNLCVSRWREKINTTISWIYAFFFLWTRDLSLSFLGVCIFIVPARKKIALLIFFYLTDTAHNRRYGKSHVHQLLAFVVLKRRGPFWNVTFSRKRFAVREKMGASNTINRQEGRGI